MIQTAIQITKQTPTLANAADTAFAEALTKVAHIAPGPGNLMANYTSADGSIVTIALQMTSVAVSPSPLSALP